MTETVLVADIGGTNARFALMAGGQFTTDVSEYLCSNFSTIDGVLEQFHHDIGQKLPNHGIFDVATPITGDHIKFTNSPWEFSRAAVEQSLGFKRLSVINDFAALAGSLPVLTAEDLSPIGHGVMPWRNPPVRTCAVLGPGTGLGVGGLVRDEDRWVPVAGEGGHVSWSPVDAFELEVLRAMWLDFDHVSAERLVSGTGLPSLYRGVAKALGTIPDPSAVDGPEISRRAFEQNDPVCLKTLEVFAGALGTVSGNLALTLGAVGGVYLAGGIAQKLADFLTNSNFRERFLAKGRFRSYLEPIPTYLITHRYAPLLGAFNIWEAHFGLTDKS